MNKILFDHVKVCLIFTLLILFICMCKVADLNFFFVNMTFEVSLSKNRKHD